MRAPESVWMAAFTADDPGDRAVFDAHLAKVRTSPENTLRAVTCDGRLVGSVASFVVDGQTEVTYWIDRAAWGRGIASRALELLIDSCPSRRCTPARPATIADRCASCRSRDSDRSEPRGVCAGPACGNRGNHPQKGLGPRASGQACPEQIGVTFQVGQLRRTPVHDSPIRWRDDRLEVTDRGQH